MLVVGFKDALGEERTFIAQAIAIKGAVVLLEVDGQGLCFPLCELADVALISPEDLVASNLASSHQAALSLAY